MNSESLQNEKGAQAHTQPAPSKKYKRKRHQKRRATDYREVKSTELSNERERLRMAGLGVGPNGIRSKLFAGVTNASGAIGHLGSTSVHQAIPLPVTSRGVGFATCAFARALSSYRGFEMPSVHSLYRAFLGIFEAKLRHVKDKFPAVNPLYTDCRDFQQLPDWVTVMKTATIVPEPIFSLMSSLGILKHGDEIYLPVMAKDHTSEDGHFVPTPETVTLSNLRSVVTALADGETDRGVQDAFFNNNPIPGCSFRGRVLTNPYDIIPRNYGSAELFRDIAEMTNVLHFVEKLIPKMVGGPLDYDAPGTTTLMLSEISHVVNMGDLRCPPLTGDLAEYGRNCFPLGNITEFWSTIGLDPAAVCHGVIGLLGETPLALRSCYPLYLRRLSESNHRRYMIDYSGVIATALAL